MAAFDWTTVEGQEFTGGEAREASDFEEVLYNFRLEPDEAWKMFGRNELSVLKRLFFAAKCSIDLASNLILFETEPRIVAVLKKRLADERKRCDGGIIL